MTAADVDLYSPQLPADPSGWSVDDHIAALREVDRASIWAKVRITGLLAGRHGDGTLQQAAEETGIAYSTLRSWRAVDKAFPVEKVGRPTFSVSVAEAFMTLKDKDELVSREQPWTVAEARALAASRKKPREARKAGKGKRPEEEVHRPGDGAPDTGEEPPAGPAQAVAPGMADTGHGTEHGTERDTEHESPQAASGPPAPADGQAASSGAAAEIPVVPGDSPDGGPGDGAAQDTQEPGLAELKAENAVLHEQAAEAEALLDEARAVCAVAAELASVVAGAWGGWQQCGVCGKPDGLPVRAVRHQTGNVAEVLVCPSCMPVARGKSPGYEFTFLVPAARADGLGKLEAERTALEAELGRLRARIGELEEAP